MNKVKDSIITEISLEVEKATKKKHKPSRKKQKLGSSDETYSWSAKTIMADIVNFLISPDIFIYPG